MIFCPYFYFSKNLISKKENDNLKKMKRKIKIGIFFFLIFFLFYFLWAGIYLPKDSHSQKKILFEIKKGESTKEIAQNLKEKNLIKNATLFRVYVFLKGISKKLKAGFYSLSASMTIPQIAEKFFLGKIEKIKITFPEGSNLKEIQQKLEKFGLIKKDLSLFKIKDFRDKFPFLKDAPQEANLEGFLFPDTYEFLYQNSEKEILEKMLKNFGKKTNHLKKVIQRKRKSLYEIVIMASLIEKEVQDFEDKKLVSGILWKRLENQMPLQVDATITFITGKKTVKIPKEDLEIDSPYNTYKYLGLPLGPISNPGLESILAAIYPKESEFWYYLSTPEGKTIFSKTLKEHNLAKAKYLKKPSFKIEQK